jgi:glutamyl-Q tRNA(Asp) synthetase
VARAAEAPDQAALDGAVYPGICRVLSSAERRARIDSGARYAIRLDARKAARVAGDLWFDESGHGAQGEHGRIRVDPARLGDVVLARGDLPASYQLAVVVDDAFQRVSLVTRGSDLSAATHTQVLLGRLLELPIPRYRHHALVLDSDGRKLSKRDPSVALRDLRERGMTPAQVLERAQALSDGDN